MGSLGSASYLRDMDSVEPTCGPMSARENRYALLLGARGSLATAGLLVAVAVVFQLGLLLVAAWILAAVGGGGIAYLAFRRFEAVLGAVLVTVLAAPLTLLLVALSWTIEPVALMGVGGWLYSRRDSRAHGRVRPQDVPDLNELYRLARSGLG